VNALSSKPENVSRQPRPQPPSDPLRDAQLHNFALRLDLRRARRNVVGSRHLAAIDRLLDANAALSRSLDWLNGKAEAVSDDFEALAQFAIESGAVAEAVTQ
jgi:hypothetical protein